MIPKHSRLILVEAHAPEGSTPASVCCKPIEYPEKADNEDSDEVHIKAEDGYSVTDENYYHFAISGKTYTNLEKYFYSLLPKALKMAHAGISLSEQEASIAAPFNSNVTNIKVVPDLIKEGRAALVTSFCMLKYMSLFQIIEYIDALLLYWHRNLFGNNQYLVHDFAIMFVIFLTMSSTPPWPELAPYRPPAQLLSPPLLFSVLFNILWGVASHTYAFLMVQEQPWYSSDDVYSACYPGNTMANINQTKWDREHSGKTNTETHDSATLYLLTSSHLVINAFVFTKGKPFRLPLYRNYFFVTVLALEVAMTVFFIFADIPGLYGALELVCLPVLWRVHIFILLIICFLVLSFVEDVILDNRKLWQWLKKVFRMKPGSNYKKMRITLDADPEWPPVKRVEYRDPCSKDMNCNMEVHSNPAFNNNDTTKAQGWNHHMLPAS